MAATEELQQLLKDEATVVLQQQLWQQVGFADSVVKIQGWCGGNGSMRNIRTTAAANEAEGTIVLAAAAGELQKQVCCRTAVWRADW